MYSKVIFFENPEDVTPPAVLQKLALSVPSSAQESPQLRNTQGGNEAESG